MGWCISKSELCNIADLKSARIHFRFLNKCWPPYLVSLCSSNCPLTIPFFVIVLQEIFLSNWKQVSYSQLGLVCPRWWNGKSSPEDSSIGFSFMSIWWAGITFRSQTFWLDILIVASCMGFFLLTINLCLIQDAASAHWFPRNKRLCPWTLDYKCQFSKPACSLCNSCV